MAYCRDGTARRNVHAGMSQGSVIGPLLWNLVCDGLLKVLDPVKWTLVIVMYKSQDIGDGVREAMKLVTV